MMRMAPTPSKNKLSPSTKKLYGCDPVPPDLTASHLCRDKPLLAKAAGPIAKKTCRACAVPNRYFIHCHELLPKFLSQLTCHLMSSGNLTYFRRLYLMCLSFCSMKPIILLTVVTILPNQWSQPTEMHLATQYLWFQFPLIKFLVLFQKVEPWWTFLVTRMRFYLHYCVRTQVTQILNFQDKGCPPHPLQG